MNFKSNSVHFYPQTYFQLHWSIHFSCLPTVARLQGFYQGLSWGRSTEGCGGSSKSDEGLRSVCGFQLLHLNCIVFLSSLFFCYNSLLMFRTGTDENAIIELLGSRTNKQRVPMVAAYKTTYGKVRSAVFQQLRLTFACTSSSCCLLFPPFVRIWSVTWNRSWLGTLKSWRSPCWWLLLTSTLLNSGRP